MKRFTPEEAKQRIYRYCAYQERCHLEVRQKLFEYGLYSSEVDALLAHLITENFLNEERFAKAFAGGKFRIKKWGRLKIVRELESRGITSNCIKIALREIDEDSYQRSLKDVLHKKLTAIDEPNSFVKKDKASKYAIQRGYEPEMVWQVLKKEQFE